MTETNDRLAQLQARRAGAAAPAGRPTAARRAPAAGSKIAAAGLGMTAMLGLVGAMALAQGNASGSPQPTQPTAPAQVVVVIHRDGGTPTGATTAGATAVAASNTPIQLSAQPVVKQAPAQAPAASTSGSR
ncbi:MAG: hypothetical protein Q7V57_06125 [Actinomycetota bacterium]|nr:hypothetical protein [Actinomycetota bacterium]